MGGASRGRVAGKEQPVEQEVSVKFQLGNPFEGTVVKGQTPHIKRLREGFL